MGNVVVVKRRPAVRSLSVSNFERSGKRSILGKGGNGSILFPSGRKARIKILK